MSDKLFCEHCWPKKRKSHFDLHIDYYLYKLSEPILRVTRYFHGIKWSYSDFFYGLFLNFLSIFGVVSFVREPDESEMQNRSLIFLREAKKRNLCVHAVKIFGRYINDFRFIYGNKSYYYEGVPLTIFEKPILDIDRKDLVKDLLQKKKVPISRGQSFTSENKALKYGEMLGFPLVVKPYNGSLSRHVVYPVSSAIELLRAIKIAKKYTPAFIVEKYIEGKLFRASVVGRNSVFVCQKEKANIIGDGISTIIELIRIKNLHPYRGDTKQRNFTLHKIPIDDILLRNIGNQGFGLESVLPVGKKIYLQDKFVLSHGCDVINCSKNVHPKNKDLFLRIANILQSDFVGIDFICPEISKSYDEQDTAILEANSLPYVDMHQYPSHGQPEPVAEIVWDIVLDRLDRQKR